MKTNESRKAYGTADKALLALLFVIFELTLS